MFKSLQNKWLIVRKSVILTDIIDSVIAQLDPFFEQAQHKAEVSSGLRDAQKQLEIIRDLAIKNGIDKEFPSILTATLIGQVVFAGTVVSAWSPAWSRLLNRGIIVNPPKPAKCLFDYYQQDESGKLVLYKEADYLIGSSPHFNGTAFDISGGEDKDISNELEIIKTATKDGGIVGFKGIKIERKQNCIHVDCVRV